MRSNSKKILGALTVAGVVAMTGSAFTASNTVESGQAGQGLGVISGYDVTGVNYTFVEHTSEGLTYDQVSFHLDARATKVRARVNTATVDGTFVNCVDPTFVAAVADNPSTTDVDESAPGNPGNGVDWTCDLVESTSAADAVALEVVAADADGVDIQA